MGRCIIEATQFGDLGGKEVAEVERLRLNKVLERVRPLRRCVDSKSRANIEGFRRRLNTDIFGTYLTLVDPSIIVPNCGID